MSDLFEDGDPSALPEQPSKTQRKKEMHALQALGARLLELKPDRLERLDLSQEMRAALEEGRRITSHEARRRHLQYIGKLMRKEDAAAIQAEVDRLEAGTQAHIAHFHRLEQWRDRLLASDDALGPFAEEFPQTDRQHLRQLIRNARREAEQGKPPASARKLFKYLRELAE